MTPPPGSAVRAIDSRGSVTTLAGPPDGVSDHADGPAGEVFFTEYGENVILRLGPG